MACVYQIKNLVNEKFYIGSTYKVFERRKGEHLTKLRANYHNNKHLQSSWNKYGEDNFIFEIVEDIQLPEDYSNDQKYELITSKEIQYITSMNPEYNLTREIRAGKLGRKLTPEECKRIGDTHRGKKLSDETKQKIKKARATQIFTEEIRRKIGEKSKGNQYCLGHKQTEEQKQKTREQVLRNNKNGIGMHSIASKEKRTNTLKIKFNTPEMKEKLKFSARNRNTHPFLCFKDSEFIGEFLSQADTADKLNLKSSEICAVLRKEQNTTKGYSFIYKDI